MHKKAEYKLTKFKSFIFNIAAGLVFLSGYLILLWNILKHPEGILASSMVKNSNIIVLFAFIGLIAVIHEFLHGLTYKIFGAKIKYGVKLLNFYTMDISGKYYSSKQILIVMLAPITLLTLLLFASGFIFKDFIYYTSIGLLFNMAGSAGDIAMTAYIILNGRGCKIKDEISGFSIYF